MSETVEIAPEAKEASEPSKLEALAEHLEFIVAEDKLTATVSRVMNAEYEGEPATLDELEQLFKTNFGLSELNNDAVKLVLEALNKFEPVVNMLIADHGQPVIDGVDGELSLIDEDQFDDAGARRQRLMMADFHPVKEGQRFAELYPATKGTDGLNVFGQIIPAKDGIELEMSPGHGARMGLESKEFTAEIDGRVELVGDQVCVSRVLEIEGDAVPAASPIEFSGMINVSGCVRDGVELRAEEGINARGLVEDAKLYAGGSVALSGGFNGGDNGLLECQGDLFARYLNNAQVMVKGKIKVEREIVSSHVYGESIDVTGGSVHGGSVAATSSICISEAGNETGIKTLLSVGVDMFREREKEEVQARIEAIKTGLKAITANLAVAEGKEESISEQTLSKIKSINANTERFKLELEELEDKFEELRKPTSAKGGEIVIQHRIYPGTVARIGRYEKRITKVYEGNHRIYFDPDRYEIVLGT